jgi:C4-dicarboxylate transporter DctQ subunit
MVATLRALALRITAWLRALVAGAVVVFFGYMAIAVLVQVLGRYVFNYSIGGAVETATFAQIWMVLLAAGIAMRRGLHVGVDALAAKFPLWLGRLVTLAVGALCLWFLWVAVIGSFGLIRVGLIQTSPSLAIPMWLPYLSLPIGLVYFAFELILALVERWHRPPGSASSGSVAGDAP